MFETALLRRERRVDSVSFGFRADPGIREALEELARREAACCPFLDYRVEAAGDELIWTTTDRVTGDARAAIDVFLDALHVLPDHPGSDIASLCSHLAEHDVHVVENRAASLSSARRGADMITATPTRHTIAPLMSQRSGRKPSKTMRGSSR